MSIKNIVVTANLRTHINLSSILNALLRKEVNCWKNTAFGSVNISLENGLLFQLFPSGRVFSIGGITEGQAKRIFMRHLRAVSGLDVCTEYKNYKVQIIVATCDLKRKLHLATIASHHRLEFEPELFPAVRYRIKDLRVTVNICHTGRCTILGAKTVEIVSEAVGRIKKLFQDAEKCRP